MAPVKFGLFKGRSKDHQEKPSTENLLQDNNSNYDVSGSPVPSTSKGLQEELLPASISMLTIDSDDDDIPSEKNSPIRRGSVGSRMDPQVNYELLQSQSSIGDVSTSLNEYDGEQYEMEELQHVDVDADSTTYDANSSELDITSITASNLSIYCASVKKAKKAKLKEEQKLRDIDMWKASNFEVMQNLLSRSGTSDEQIKWEAIATARGLCTLNDTCTCSDCKMPRYLVSFNDGDAGMAATPLLNAIADCTLQ
ncbi:PREDICTED: uncharacterized protein LOC106101846 [Papilio polytes]|uniref:uncharacterized protein LOC106101846 n=1 Tax=Papilio polytes TaxID=76194 RepID=UPI000675F6FB|nr:PREDICTED: uncharacterized protein LOC106101846 [Papilio polytes]